MTLLRIVYFESSTKVLLLPLNKNMKNPLVVIGRHNCSSLAGWQSVMRTQTRSESLRKSVCAHRRNTQTDNISILHMNAWKAYCHQSLQLRPNTILHLQAVACRCRINMYRYQRRTKDFTMEKLTGVDPEIFQKGSEA